jgi:hypothetical protein
VDISGHDWKWRIILEVIMNNKSEPGRQMDSLGMNDQEVLHDPRTTSDPIQLCLRSLQDLMQLLPPSASEVG